MTLALLTPLPFFSLSANRLRPRKWSSPESSGIRDLRRPYYNINAMQTRQSTLWLGSALQRLAELADLEPGWDEAAALPIPPSLIAAVRDFLTSGAVSELTVEPSIVPTLKGSLLIEWHSESVDLIIEADPESTPSFYFFDNETDEEVEAPLGQRLDVVAKAFKKLAKQD